MRRGLLLSFRRAGWGLVGTGVVVLLLMALGVEAPVRAWLAFVFFAAGPGTALAPLLGVSDGAVAAVLAVALSLVVTVIVAQVMVWAHLFSPVAAVALLLAGMVLALCRPARSAQEVRR